MERVNELYTRSGCAREKRSPSEDDAVGSTHERDIARSGEASTPPAPFAFAAVEGGGTAAILRRKKCLHAALRNSHAPLHAHAPLQRRWRLLAQLSQMALCMRRHPVGRSRRAISLRARRSCSSLCLCVASPPLLLALRHRCVNCSLRGAHARTLALSLCLRVPSRPAAARRTSQGTLQLRMRSRPRVSTPSRVFLSTTRSSWLHGARHTVWAPRSACSRTRTAHGQRRWVLTSTSPPRSATCGASLPRAPHISSHYAPHPLTHFLFLPSSKRYSALVENGVITKLNVEQEKNGTALECSLAPVLLSAL